MASYKAPLREMQFVLHEVLGLDQALAQMPRYAEVSPDLVDAVLEEGGKIAEEVLLPINRAGDEEGCQYQAGGVVVTPKGYKEAYKTFREAGWTSLAGDAEFGGQQMPKAVQVLFEEMVYATNTSFQLYCSLSMGAYQALAAHATDALKQTFLPKLVDGSWTGTMCLTEAHSGTDLGLLRSKAVPAGEGAYAITGSKIFITGGEHDLSDNIVHLVLARLPDAPEGVRGISLFLVPKFLVNADGSLGARNGIVCGAIEHKMGIKASSTCVMNLDGAIGYLVGEPNKGLAAMFTMMNAERLSIGIQGIGLAEASYQNAVLYARDRIQGRAANGAEQPEKAADPIIVHPDVRRMLLTMRAQTEAARCFAAYVGTELDKSKYHPDAAVRERSEALVALLTPVAKAFFTDYGFEATVMGMQVFGGHGYVREWGMEQFVRDARIAQIYEGTNGVQALDLAGRKVVGSKGQWAELFFAEVEDFLGRDGGVHPIFPGLRHALAQLKEATAFILGRAGANKDEIGAASADYLRLFGLTAFAYMWARMDRIAEAKLNDDMAFYGAKRSVARFYAERVLPDATALLAKIKAGAEPLMALDAELF
ncbi:MAG: acyl-CoA dehydrogenase C-terminal domain-containing protein [Gammaproteobacteria bacterium]|nr:acyl-CoA dehydrogenase C-terminal domain-containing protein [Gammaproteobacteria bacterium]